MKRKVVIVDIDGVLANYEDFFKNWLLEKTGRSFVSAADAKELLGSQEYEELKSLYRSSGAKRDLGLIDSALPEMFRTLKTQEFEIAVLSSRPANKFSNIYADTFIWLGEHGIWFDSLFFSEKKYLTILQQFPDADVYVIEDDILQALAITRFFSEEQEEAWRVFCICKSEERSALTLKIASLGRNIIFVKSAIEAVDIIIQRDKKRRAP